MLPGGKLYVPGAEKLLPNIRRLTDAARRGDVFLVSHGCFHAAIDPEFERFPPHCIKGTAGSAFVPEALTGNYIQVENLADASLPDDLFAYQQIILEKQTLDIFQSFHAEALLRRFGITEEFVVFGVVTEFCVGFAARGLLERGRRVVVVRDAIATLASDAGDGTLRDLQNLGARLVTTDEILEQLASDSRHR